jgi:hypothetical protein
MGAKADAKMNDKVGHCLSCFLFPVFLLPVLYPNTGRDRRQDDFRGESHFLKKPEMAGKRAILLRLEAARVLLKGRRTSNPRDKKNGRENTQKTQKEMQCHETGRSKRREDQHERDSMQRPKCPTMIDTCSAKRKPAQGHLDISISLLCVSCVFCGHPFSCALVRTKRIVWFLWFNFFASVLAPRLHCGMRPGRPLYDFRILK